MRSRLTELTNYLVSKKDILNVRSQQIESFVENGTTEEGGRKLTEKGYNVLNFRYSSVIYIEEMPRKSLAYLLCFVNCWLDDNDDTRDKHKLSAPNFEFIKIDGKKNDVEIYLDFVDDFYISEKENGPIDWANKTFSLDEYELWTAETLSGVEGDIKE